MTKVEIGNATLYLGDCMDVLPTLAKVDAVITDPPYGIGLQNRDVDGHRSDRWNKVAGDESQELGIHVLQQLNDGETLVAAFASPFKEWPGRWRNRIVWDKGGAVGGGGDIATCLKRSWELLQVFNPAAISGPRLESVWRFPITPQDTANHICEKPVALMIKIISVFGAESKAILDPFMGIGTTGVAAIQLGRKFIGIEREPKYFDIACQRIEQAVAQGQLFEPPAPKQPEQAAFFA